jgi:hypothetical protein
MYAASAITSQFRARDIGWFFKAEIFISIKRESDTA